MNTELESALNRNGYHFYNANCVLFFTVLIGCDPELEDFCAENARCTENPTEDHFDCYCLPGFVGNGYENCEGWYYDKCLKNSKYLTSSNTMYSGEVPNLI